MFISRKETKGYMSSAREKRRKKINIIWLLHIHMNISMVYYVKEDMSSACQSRAGNYDMCFSSATFLPAIG